MIAKGICRKYYAVLFPQVIFFQCLFYGTKSVLSKHFPDFSSVLLSPPTLIYTHESA